MKRKMKGLREVPGRAPRETSNHKWALRHKVNAKLKCEGLDLLAWRGTRPKPGSTQYTMSDSPRVNKLDEAELNKVELSSAVVAPFDFRLPIGL